MISLNVIHTSPCWCTLGVNAAYCHSLQHIVHAAWFSGYRTWTLLSTTFHIICSVRFVRGGHCSSSQSYQKAYPLVQSAFFLPFCQPHAGPTKKAKNWKKLSALLVGTSSRGVTHIDENQVPLDTSNVSLVLTIRLVFTLSVLLWYSPYQTSSTLFEFLAPLIFVHWIYNFNAKVTPTCTMSTWTRTYTYLGVLGTNNPANIVIKTICRLYCPMKLCQNPSLPKPEVPMYLRTI